jgi:hypothetical protein
VKGPFAAANTGPGERVNAAQPRSGIQMASKADADSKTSIVPGAQKRISKR